MLNGYLKILSKHKGRVDNNYIASGYLEVLGDTGSEYKRHWMGTGGVNEPTVGSFEWVSGIWHDQESKGN